MRKKIVTGNWKMNKTPSDAVALVEQLKDKIDTDDVDVVLCVPFVSLAGVGNAIKGTSIKLGAQNMHFENCGAYTGEISGTMLKEMGVEYVIPVSYTHLDVYKRQCIYFYYYPFLEFHFCNNQTKYSFFLFPKGNHYD